MRLFASLLVLVLLVSCSYALWEHTANILVQDAQNRPIPHAKVKVIWQATDKDETHSESGITDYMGIFTLNMTNYVQFPNKVSYSATAIAEYGEGALYVTANKKFDVRGHPDPVPITLPLYRVKINVKTPYNQPVGGATLYISPWTLETDSAGSATFILPAKTTTVVAKIGDAQSSEKITVKGDAEINMTLKVYRLTVRVVDQHGNPQSALIKLDNETYPTDSKGIYVFNPFPGYTADIRVYSRGREMEEQLNMTNDKELLIAFDYASPNIIDVSRQPLDGGNKIVLATIIDEGKYASGLDSVTLFWLLDGVAKEPIEMYPKDARTFSATLPAQPENAIVSYYIQAVDKRGNSILSEKQTYGGKPAPPIQTDNQTNQTGENVSPSFNLGQINWWLVIGAGAIIIIALLVYIYIRGD